MKGRLEGGEVGELTDAVARDGDQAIEIRRFCGPFLAILVDETTGVNSRHLAAVQSSDFLEFTGGFDAAVLRQENGDGVVAEGLDLLFPGRGLVCGGIAPRVVVKGEEIAALVVGTAIHVVCGFNTVIINIGSGVSDRDRAVLTIANVLFHVPSDSLDVWCGYGRGNTVDDLVSGEEQQSVAV